MDLSRQHVPRSAAQLLQAMAEEAEQTDLDFDVYGSGARLQSFEASVAALLGAS